MSLQRRVPRTKTQINALPLLCSASLLTGAWFGQVTDELTKLRHGSSLRLCMLLLLSQSLLCCGGLRFELRVLAQQSLHLTGQRVDLLHALLTHSLERRAIGVMPGDGMVVGKRGVGAAALAGLVLHLRVAKQREPIEQRAQHAFKLLNAPLVLHYACVWRVSRRWC